MDGNDSWEKEWKFGSSAFEGKTESSWNENRRRMKTQESWPIFTKKINVLPGGVDEVYTQGGDWEDEDEGHLWKDSINYKLHGFNLECLPYHTANET